MESIREGHKSCACDRELQKLQVWTNTHFYAFNCAIVHQSWDIIRRKNFVDYAKKIYFSVAKLEEKILVKKISAERRIV